MITVSFECATRSIGLAVMEDQKVRGELYCDPERHHSEVLIPLLETLMQMTGIKMRDVDLWACSLGPGSFTSLRIGISTVKGLAIATGKPVTGVSTLATIAGAYLNSSWPVCPLLDARGNMVYAGLYGCTEEGLPILIGEERLIEIGSLLQQIQEQGTIFFVGDGAIKHKEVIIASRNGKAMIAERAPKLSAYWVGLMGRREYQAGNILDTRTFAPRYLRGFDAKISP